ncbi:PREDICTED: protein FANTASTIC FOUR 3-like isoform X2 [Lupinus angustifolius]|uniref:protein FANTASTIC FOUR 3-like isoform X2 n=1 Tax=Lupinus angustifolius TaxID=3871 RepID=UPI00092EC10C|nr:PREDICTED: protein FANTASTIC FOUR 3-like isoform X2 [Lupinus angustifolius]
MSAIVCHGLQSHIESQIVESRTLRLRLPSSKPFPTHSQQPFDLAFKPCLWDSNIKTNNHEESKNNNKIETQTALSSNPNNTSSWSFLETLSNVSTNEISPQYVHPQHNRSSLILSPRSLELCTENLGSESGSDIVENEIDMDINMNMNMNMQRQPCKVLAAKKGKTMNFPPPLTTITGSESLRVMPHREDGRLVIEVTKAPPMFVSSFHAERSHGRLRLHLLNNHIPCFDPEDDEEEEEEKDVDYDFDEEFENEMNGHIECVEEGVEEVDDDDDDVTCESSMLVENSVGLDPIIVSGFSEEFENGVNGQRRDAEKGEEEVHVDDGYECDMRMEKYERLRRCKEGGEHENIEFMLNWGEPRWVVTS